MLISAECERRGEEKNGMEDYLFMGNYFWLTMLYWGFVDPVIIVIQIASLLFSPPMVNHISHIHKARSRIKVS